MAVTHKIDSIKQLHEREAEQAAIPVRLSGNEQALAELGVMAATNESTLQGLTQAIAEIGTLIGGI